MSRPAYYADDWLTVYQGDCREVMAAMEPESVHCVVTSPPYWGLRDYGVGGQLGLEPTPEEYVANMVAVFREVRRVLRADGTLWLNLGDTYFTRSALRERGNRDVIAGIEGEELPSWSEHAAAGRTRYSSGHPFLKDKDLVGIPWRVALALQEDGWWLRQNIVWSKPVVMPESVYDRPTTAHEFVFLLAKSRHYYYDAEAVAEPVSPNTHARVSQNVEAQIGSRRANGGARAGRPMKAVVRAPGVTPKTAEPGQGIKGNTSFREATVGRVETRNLRTVWTVAPQQYKGAHFATFPEKLVEPCIKAGCPTLGTVLDPFAGSGTTGRVAQRLSRRAVLIDLNADYLVQAMARNRDIPLGLEAS